MKYYMFDAYYSGLGDRPAAAVYMVFYMPGDLELKESVQKISAKELDESGRDLFPWRALLLEETLGRYGLKLEDAQDLGNYFDLMAAFKEELAW